MTTHKFNSALGRDVFELGASLMLVQSESMPRLEEERPVMLQTIDPKLVAIEMDRLKRPQWRGLPHE